ncbi:hypothetical protein HX773_19705 [Pantoea sp. B9002]|jgi:OOP family OmpA-OmpF porin|uniref:hypothetical protein n=1 Tax=Pantoea sp. B9002 TaxID=2726979 RepID=UPI00159FBB6F|nr:hypothetical protein [Pantoea sp. B9002]NWA63136.1 hypothetical protein [Pantoea sp. B9002]
MTKRIFLLTFFMLLMKNGFAIHPTPENASTIESTFVQSELGQHQARIVYYRKDDRFTEGTANLYVNGEYHASLQPNSYVVFCLTPGEHFISAWTKEAPHYLGKEALTGEYQLAQGETVYLRVDSEINGRSVNKPASMALNELSGLDKSIHLLSRASTIQVCHKGVVAP